MLFAWFMLGGLILLFAPRGLTGRIQLGFARVFRWPLSVGGNFALTRSTDQLVRDVVPRVEYEKLQVHINNLRATLDREREKYRTFYGLYNDPVWDGANFALAKVITADTKDARKELTVDYSKDARLVEGQFVLGNESIIGTIADASAGTAHVKLLTDSTSAIPVKIGNLGVRMMMVGNGDNSARISLVEAKHEIKVGDAVFASDARTSFLDAPVMVGTVARCVKDRKNPLLWDITVKPACDIENLDSVSVIIINPQK